MNTRCNVRQLGITLLFILVLIGTVLLVGAVSWSSDIRLTTDSFWDINPSITQTMNGSVWIVWSSDRIAYKDELFYTTSPDYGATWFSARRLTTSGGFDLMPSIIQTANSWIWVVWASDRTGNYEIFYKTSPDHGATWSGDAQMTINASRDGRPSITQDATGTIWVVWMRNIDGNYELFYTTSPDYGATWTGETQLTTDPSWDIWPSVTYTRNGEIWVVWSSLRTGDYELFYTTSPDYGATWTIETPLTTDPDFDERPSIIQAIDDSIWVVWQSDRAGGTRYELFYTTSPDYGSTWTPDTQLTSDSDEDMSPSIFNTDDGRIWVTWSTDRTGEPDPNYEIFYKFSDVIPIHDVAITDVTPSATQVTGGETVTVSVVTENQGTMSETFDVNCYANLTLIGSETITLSPGASTTPTFPWSTPFSNATYEISATATTVPGETDTSDNTFTDGTVEVVRPPVEGDIDGDGDVDLDDLYYVLMGYGMTIEEAMAIYGVPPETDIDGDGTVDLDDLYYVLRDYGES